MVSKHSAKLHSGELGVLAGYEAIHMIRKGQARWSAAGAKVGLPQIALLDWKNLKR
jgi:hypothetical protein